MCVCILFCGRISWQHTFKIIRYNPGMLTPEFLIKRHSDGLDCPELESADTLPQAIAMAVRDFHALSCTGSVEVFQECCESGIDAEGVPYYRFGALVHYRLSSGAPEEVLTPEAQQALDAYSL